MNHKNTACMKKENRIKLQKLLGIILMLIAFPIIPDHYPWYAELLLYNLGLVLLLSTKWRKLKNELKIIKIHK